MPTIQWSSTEELRIGQSEYKGKKYFSVRIWWTTPTGEMAPGKQGINIPMDRLKEFMEALNTEAFPLLGWEREVMDADAASKKQKRGKA